MSMLLFICLPLIVLSAVLAVWLHYRQKRRKALEEGLADDSEPQLAPVDTPSQLLAVSPLAQEDKLGLIRECRKQLTKSRAKFLALKHDVSSFRESLPASSIENNSHMESINEKIAAYEKQIADLQNKLEVLETVFPVQDEAHFLRQAIRERDGPSKA
ncbi:MAG: hypothetical protein QM755_01710 [Luteolibacter sp.]